MDYEKQNEELVQRYKVEPSPEIIGTLYQLNFKLFRKLVRRYKGLAEEDDLLQECYFSVMKAAETYEPGKGAFVSFLSSVIVGDLFRYVQAQDTIRIPEYMQELIRKYMRLDQDGKTDIYICQILQIDQAELERVRAAARLKSCRSLSEPVSGDQDGDILQDLIVDQGEALEDVAIQRAYNIELREALERALDNLTEKQAEAVRRRFFREDESGSNDRALYKKGLRKLKREKSLFPFRDEMQARAYIGTGLQTWKRTNTSSVERVYFELEELQELQEHGRRS